MTNRSTANFYTGATLDRAGALRKDPDAIARHWRSPAARLLAVWRGRFLMRADMAAPAPLPLDDAGDWGRPDAWWRAHAADQPLFLGLAPDGDSDGEARQTPWFAIDLSPLDDAETHPRLEGLGVFADLRALAAHLDAPTAGLLAYTRALTGWHHKHRFCGVCGAATVADEGGHTRRCANPDEPHTHFPRTDPAVIMLVHDGDRCLLGRSPRFPPGRYSTLAGFVEPGESLEMAVAREVMEEAGVPVTDIRYHSSQPWPFPASLMLGFHARALDSAIHIDNDELEDARWFTRAQVRAAPPETLPPADSISRRLIADWLAGLAL